MSSTGSETGNHNIEIAGNFVIWNRQVKLGKLFDSSTCFRLPNGEDHSPDIAWICQDRWNSFITEKKFPPIASDFGLVLLFPNDSRKEVQAKMQAYTNSGVRLDWLIRSQNPPSGNLPPLSNSPVLFQIWASGVVCSSQKQISIGKSAE